MIELSRHEKCSLSAFHILFIFSGVTSKRLFIAILTHSALINDENYFFDEIINNRRHEDDPALQQSYATHT